MYLICIISSDHYQLFVSHHVEYEGRPPVQQLQHEPRVPAGGHLPHLLPGAAGDTRLTHGHVSRGSSGHGVVTADHGSLHIARCAPRHGRDSTELPNSASACAVLHRTVLYYTPLLRAAQWHCCEENQLPIFHSLAILVLWSF